MNRILIIEDNPSDLKILSSLLQRKGFETNDAGDAYKALDMLVKNRYELIVLDWMLPKVSGLELLKTIRAQKALRLTPVIFITSRSETTDIKQAIDEGVSDYIIKPIDPMILDSKISRLLKQSDVWQMTKIPENLGRGASLKIQTKILGLSEVAIEFFSPIKPEIMEIFVLEAMLFNTIGLSECRVRIQECRASEIGFIVSGTLVGLKESELKAIRMLLKSSGIIQNSSKMKSESEI